MQKAQSLSLLDLQDAGRDSDSDSLASSGFNQNSLLKSTIIRTATANNDEHRRSLSNEDYPQDRLSNGFKKMLTVQKRSSAGSLGTIVSRSLNASGSSGVKRMESLDSSTSGKVNLSSSQSCSQSRKSRHGRPLPKPPSGAETINASVTRHFLNKDKLITGTNKRTTLSPSRSYNDMPFTESSSHGTSSYPLDKSNLSKSLSRSWNDIIKSQNSHSTLTPEEPLGSSSPIAKRRNASLNDDLKDDGLSASQNLSSSLGQSFSSKVLQIFKKNNNLADSNSEGSSTFEQLPSSGEPSPSVSRRGTLAASSASSSFRSRSDSPSASFRARIRSDSTYDRSDRQHCDLDNDLLTIDLYTTTKASLFYNFLTETWIQELIDVTLALKENKKSPLSKNIKKPRKETVEKFSELKYDIIHATRIEDLFLLTKELGQACEKYPSVKRQLWKSTDLVNFYLLILQRYTLNGNTDRNSRADELE